MLSHEIAGSPCGMTPGFAPDASSTRSTSDCSRFAATGGTAYRFESVIDSDADTTTRVNAAGGIDSRQLRDGAVATAGVAWAEATLAIMRSATSNDVIFIMLKGSGSLKMRVARYARHVAS